MAALALRFADSHDAYDWCERMLQKADIEAVMAVGGTPPAVNQCAMSVKAHDDATIAYCNSLKIAYEA